jgi:hypothetical protein|tara:strand:- start:49679 stop:50017 length:339 start_codon:yes stop_codon:yes gene_type:complete
MLEKNYDTYKNVDLGSGINNAKAAKGDVYGWYAYNTGSTAVFIRLFDDSDAISDGLESSCKFSFTIPADGGSNVNWPGGIKFGAGISVNCSTNVTGLSAPTGESVNLSLFFK